MPTSNSKRQTPNSKQRNSELKTQNSKLRRAARRLPGNFENKLRGPAIGGVADAAADAEVEDPRLQIDVDGGKQAVILFGEGTWAKERAVAGVVFGSECDALHDFPRCLELEVEFRPRAPFWTGECPTEDRVDREQPFAGAVAEHGAEFRGPVVFLETFLQP